jgi:excisionase family DNA binding protein
MAVALALDDAVLDQLADELAARLAARIPQAQPNDDCWLDTEQAASYLSLPVSTIHKLTAGELIPFSQNGPRARCYFKRSELDEWREASRQGPR